MALPTWLLDRTDETSPLPTAALGQLLVWLDAPENRAVWRNTRLTREAALIEAERVLNQAQFGRRKPASPDLIVELRENVAETRGLVGLAELAEEFAERTRLRIAATANRPTHDSDVVVRDLAGQINLGTRRVIEALTESEHIYPDEAHRHAEAALDELTSGHRSARATGSASDLRVWVEALKLALDVTKLTTERA